MGGMVGNGHGYDCAQLLCMAAHPPVVQASALHGWWVLVSGSSEIWGVMDSGGVTMGRSLHETSMT